MGDFANLLERFEDLLGGSTFQDTIDACLVLDPSTLSPEQAEAVGVLVSHCEEAISSREGLVKRLKCIKCVVDKTVEDSDA